MVPRTLEKLFTTIIFVLEAEIFKSINSTFQFAQKTVMPPSSLRTKQEKKLFKNMNESETNLDLVEEILVFLQ